MRTGSFLALIGCVAALVFATGASAADSVYWTNDFGNSIGVAPLDGNGGGSTILPTPVGADEPYGTAIDAATGKVYWADAGTDSIKVANLDGTSAETLDTGAAPLDGPEGLAIDPAAGRVYWANINSNTISWAAIDGSGGGEVNTTGAPISEPAGVAVAPAEGRIYWASYRDSLLGWANLDESGGGEVEVPLALLNGPDGVAIDASANRIYWTNYDEETIAYADLGGGLEAGELDTGALLPESPTGIAIDPEAGSLYWADESGFVASVSLAGGEATALDISGASPSEPSFPALLEKPKFEPTSGAETADLRAVGSTLTCGSIPTEPDLVESFLYRAPQAIAYAWAHEGAPLAGATGKTLVPTEPGDYSCDEIATNGAGSTEIVAGTFGVFPPGQGQNPPSTPSPPAMSQPAPIHVTLPSVGVIEVKRDLRHGTATLLAKVNGPGTMSLSGPKVVRDRIKVAGAGLVKLKVVIKGSPARALRRDGKALVRLRITFVTPEGVITARARTLVLRLVTE